MSLLNPIMLRSALQVLTLGSPGTEENDGTCTTTSQSKANVQLGQGLEQGSRRPIVLP